MMSYSRTRTVWASTSKLKYAGDGGQQGEGRERRGGRQDRGGSMVEGGESVNLTVSSQTKTFHHFLWESSLTRGNNSKQLEEVP